MRKLLLLSVFALLISSLYSCKSKEARETDERNAYLEENNITVAPTASGLYYVETLEGTGVQAIAGDNVVVHYTGKFLNGDVFDSSYGRNEPFEFELGSGYVIKGWDEGIALMKVGGKATLIIPSDLAYGPYGSGIIPGYTTIVFDVELLEVK
ncbi:MAG: FKBP-type peptidyl-prolyl cis-trans isomerase [Bacteroidales bacterium]|nr:FKBP-type peptidyl-prolyl cis-trans isomerase [Bacteroidales bacterium]